MTGRQRRVRGPGAARRLAAGVVAVALASMIGGYAAGNGVKAGDDSGGCTPSSVATLRARAERGAAADQKALADALVEARCVGQDLAEAARWYQASARGGNVDAKFRLGMMYLDGRGVPPSVRQGAAWLLEAAEGGHPKSQYAIGSLYASGRGVTQNYVQAHKWITVSIRDDDEHAREVLKTLERMMTPAELAAAARQADEWRQAHK